MNHNLEKNVKRWFKKKVSITMAIVTLFAINGSVGFANISTFSSITADKTGSYGSDSVDALKNNLKEMDVSVNKNLGYEKITLLGTWSKVKDYKTVAIGGVSGLMKLAGDAEKQEAVIKSKMKDAVKKQIETIYGKDFEKNAKFKKDFEEAKVLPSKTHTAVADLSNYLPKVLDKADEVVSKVNEHDRAIEENRASIAKNFVNQEEKIQENKREIEHLNKKVEKGTSMLVAMANVDFQDLREGDIGIGAGVGSYSGAQAVAVGVAYAVNEDMKVHAKWGTVAGDPHYNALGGGISYRFRTR